MVTTSQDIRCASSLANGKSMLWSGEFPVLGCAGPPASSLHGCGGNYIVSRQRPPDPLQHKLAHWLDLDGILDFRQYTRADEDLSRLGRV